MTDQQDIQQFNDRPFHAYFVEDSMPTPSVSDSGIETRRSQLCDTMINESSHLSSGSSNGETVSSPIASGPSTCGSFRDETRMHDVGSQWLYFQETETEDAGNLESGISGATSIVDAAWANNLLSELFSTASE
ncbi:hypothetical protein PENVUL_c040G00559 [Penicillium vulpinum]|uniref:Uncharacterized protein n=1 Tax=Penicillium vulpinum TaxID=29845 RepID=A0A1V6RKQ6_9EURO|nr:hypothetical protein PENVUL_c040G00559 [Penicillium vulpinum]